MHAVRNSLATCGTAWMNVDERVRARRFHSADHLPSGR